LAKSLSKIGKTDQRSMDCFALRPMEPLEVVNG